MASANMSRYETLVRKLYQVNLYCTAKLGLENIQALHQASGSPLKRVPNIIHVGGTNGKGSVAFKLAKALEYSHIRTGLFVSPHIASFRERMQVDGQLITEAEVEELLGEVLRVREVQAIPATFFEITTALAFNFFSRRQLGAAVIEVGLGGRLDATNIIHPRLSIITSIGLEHTRILGTTIQAIAREKAGIIKPGVPVVLGPHVPHDLLGSIAAERSAPVLLVPKGPYPNFEEENTAIARTALNHLRTSSPPLAWSQGADTEAALVRGLQSRPPCRFEELERQVAGQTVRVVLDVGHNPPALRRLFERLLSPTKRDMKTQKISALTEAEKPVIRLVLGLSADKDITECLQTVLQFVDPSHVHIIQARHPRAAAPQALVSAAASLGAPLPRMNYGYANIKEGIGAALHAAVSAYGGGDRDEQKRPETVVVCGTFFIMGEVREALGLTEPHDSAVIAEVAGAQFAAAQELFENVPSSLPPRSSSSLSTINGG
ncbi:folylpolyglutamate synthase [Nannochloropsis oceanica]